MFAMIKALDTDVESFVNFNVVSTQDFPPYKGSGQGRILPPFIYKVYINRLMETVCNGKYCLVIDNLRTGSPTFADDMTLLSLFPIFWRHYCISSFKRRRVYLILGILGAAFNSKTKLEEDEITCQFKTARHFLNHAV